MPIGETYYGKERRYDQPRMDSQLFSKYEVISVIGKGSFSQVLRVQHRLTRQFYAVKLVSSDSGKHYLVKIIINF
jgi:protein serine kinase H